MKSVFKIFRPVGLLAAALGLFFAPTTASAVNVSLELALVVDESGSINATEWNLQRSGYVAAFQSTAVHNAILASANGIAVTYIQFADGVQTGIGWTHLTDAASSNAFANQIAGLARAFSAGTGVAQAIDFAVDQFGFETGQTNDNGFTSSRQVIDVSGDGANNRNINGGTSPAPAANLTDLVTDAAIAAGIDAINGIVINPNGEAGLLTFYQTQVQQGNGSFTAVADGFDDFAPSIEAKIEREITTTPEGGSTIACLGLSLVGLGALRKLSSRRRQA
jgi:hypothetical protein